MDITKPLGYRLAQISTASHQEDPRRLGRIYLDIDGSGQWIYRQLVFVGYPKNLAPLIKDESSQDVSNKELGLPPVGAYVVAIESIVE
jgi:hypothetical protein